MEKVGLIVYREHGKNLRICVGSAFHTNDPVKIEGIAKDLEANYFGNFPGFYFVSPESRGVKNLLTRIEHPPYKTAERVYRAEIKVPWGEEEYDELKKQRRVRLYKTCEIDSGNHNRGYLDEDVYIARKVISPERRSGFARVLDLFSEQTPEEVSFLQGIDFATTLRAA